MSQIPQLQAKEFSIDTDPSGSRHQTTGNGFVKFLGTAANQQLDFASLNIETSGGITEPHVILYRVNDFGDGSGVFNMRFYLSSISSWQQGTFRFLQRIEKHFQGGSILLNESDNDTPTTQPTSLNLLATDGSTFLSGVLDEDVTQYVYLAVLAEEDTAPGIKGGAGNGGFRYRLLFDWS